MELDTNHKLYKLSSIINWLKLESEIKQNFDISDRYECRFVIGLLYLKSMSGLSSKEVVDKWQKDPYWRYLCGGRPTGKTEIFPYAPAILDIWDREFSGKGYEAMIGALLRSLELIRK